MGWLVLFNSVCLVYYISCCLIAFKAWRKGACSSSLGGYFAGALIVGFLCQFIGSLIITNSGPKIVKYTYPVVYDCTNSEARYKIEFLKTCYEHPVFMDECISNYEKLYCKVISIDTLKM